jgi:diguanylate cyclase (GGDEF)-like protein
MIELRGDRLAFSFPEVHPRARFTIGFQRTLRIPDDGREYPLPAGLGEFPLRHVDDHADTVPAPWLERGGVILPMHQAEALWISFGAGYPAAVKVAAGKINAVSGEGWSTTLRGPVNPRFRPRASAEQDYLVLPQQPWLDGFHVATGQIRQFVAMPLGGGHTAEEQLTGRAEVGGIQLLAYPMGAEWYQYVDTVRYRGLASDLSLRGPLVTRSAAPPDMGLGLGGLMRQAIEADPYGTEAWDLEHPARCFVHLVNAEQWEAITGEPMPTAPIAPATYARHGIPWFDYAAPGPKAPGSKILAELRTVAEVEQDAGHMLPDNAAILIDRVGRLRDRPGHAVGEGADQAWAPPGPVSPHVDPMTGLMNRRAFDELLELPHFDALAFLDIDHMKGINDQLGADRGDLLLGLFAKSLRDWCDGRQPSRAVPFRLGGQTFAVLAAGSNAEELAQQVHALQLRMAIYDTPEGRKRLTFSAGVTAWLAGEQPSDVRHRCNQALLAAKRNGRAQVVVLGPTNPGDGAA